MLTRTIRKPNDGRGRAWRLAPCAHLPSEDPQEPETPHKPPPVPADEPPPVPEGDPPSDAPPERAQP